MASSGVDINTEMNIQIMPVACSHIDVNAIRNTSIESMVNGGGVSKKTNNQMGYSESGDRILAYQLHTVRQDRCFRLIPKYKKE